MPTDLNVDFLTEVVLNHQFVVLTNSSGEPAKFGGFEHYLAFSNQREISAESHLFGFFTFEAFNQHFKVFEQGQSWVKFPEQFFFNPEHLLRFEKLNLDIEKKPFNNAIQLKPNVSEKEYVEKVEKIKQHIYKGDVYEINFCIQFEGNAKIDPVETYFSLNQFSPSPFSCFVKHNDQFLLCASPERFLKSEDNRLISQPIKGTARRATNPILDQEIAKQLQGSSKERAENIMIVDLVRNDLSMVCEAGTVKVDELCGVYSYRHVHQLISTVVGKMEVGLGWRKAVEAMYPMGSMTGAPKHKAMELISKFETRQRGLFSGAVGYVKPNGDFDFNVVIRSILYDSITHQISVNVGSAITASSDPIQEYDECFLKAEALLKVLNKDFGQSIVFEK